MCFPYIATLFNFLYSRPFPVRLTGAPKFVDWNLNKLVFKQRCLDRHDYILNTLEEFLGKYKNEAKFSLSWITDLAHDDINGKQSGGGGGLIWTIKLFLGVYYVDMRFRDFFNRTKKQVCKWPKSSFCVSYVYNLIQ